MENDEILEKIIEEEDVQTLSQAFFDVELYKFQEEIVRDISFDNENRIAITTPSQAGKSWALAIATAIYVLLHEDKTVLIISSTRDQAKLIRDKFAHFVVESDPLFDMLEDSGVSSEVSKKKMDFTNGCTVKTLSASGQNEGQSLMGHGLEGGGVILLDEANLIPDKIIEKRILRMLGSAPESTLVKIGNPTDRNHFYESLKKDDDYKQIQVNHEDAVEQGTFTQSYVDEMREEMTERNFKVNIMAEFPDRDSDNTLIQYSKLQESRGRSVPECGKEPTALYGLDVARMGDDSTVLTRVERCNGFYEVTDTWKWDIGDTMRIANKVETIMNERGEEHVNVDTHGIGSGVQDRLNEKGLYSVGLKVGMSADNKDQFLRKKSEYFWKLRSIFEDGDISIPESNQELFNDLDDMRIEYNSRDKVKVAGPSGRSPDFADSLMLALSYERGSDVSPGAGGYSAV